MKKYSSNTYQKQTVVERLPDIQSLPEAWRMRRVIQVLLAAGMLAGAGSVMGGPSDNGQENVVKYDSSGRTSVTLGNTGTPVRLKNVAAGATSTDAINLGQLAATAQNTASALGGGATASATGAISAPSYTLTNANTITSSTGALNNVGGALTRVDNALGSLNTSIGQNTTSIGGINTQLTTINGTLANAVMYDSSARTSVTLGTAGTLVRLKNVAAGAASTDAVNLGQLATTAQNAATALGGGATASATGVITAPSYTLTNANTITSSSGALTNVGGALTRVDSALGSLNTSIGQNTTSIGGINTQLTTINGTLTNVVKYDSSAHASVTLGNAGTPVSLKNVAAGTLSASSTDAVNGSQLYTTNQQISTISGTLADAVMYDTSAHGSVTLGTAGTPVQLKNVAVGTLSASSTDAVNGSQLYATNQQISSISGSVADAVLYDTPAHTSVTLGTAGTPVTVSNVAAGTLSASSTDAVNGSQLYTTNQQISTISGTLADAVMYDSPAHSSVTLGTVGTPVQLKNVAAGTLSASSTDAVNGSQLYATNQDVAQNTSDIAGIISGGGVKYFHANSTLADSQATAADSVAIGGNAKATAANSVALGANSTTTANLSQAAYNPGSGTIAGVTPVGEVSVGSAGAERRITNVAAGAADTDAVNVSQLRQITTAAVTDAVFYDSSAHGTVTFGGSGSSTPVRLRNVAAGVTATDAVNMSQLTALQTSVSTLDGQVAAIIGGGGGGGGGSGLPYVSGNANGDVSNAANSGNTAGVAVGYNSSAAGENSSVIGQNATAGGKYGVAIGNDSYAAGRHDTAIGGNARVYADGSLAAGSNATISAEATNAVAVGADANVTAASASAIGQGASATAANSVALGKGSVADRENAVSVGAVGNERQITNVAPGVEPTDAVNVTQMQGVASQASAYTDQQVNSARKQASAGTAAAIAIANLPQPYEANKSMVSIAVGGFDGESGYALGVSHSTPSGWVFKAAASGNSRSKYGGGIGAGFQW